MSPTYPKKNINDYMNNITRPEIAIVYHGNTINFDHLYKILKRMAGEELTNINNIEKQFYDDLRTRFLAADDQGFGHDFLETLDWHHHNQLNTIFNKNLFLIKNIFLKYEKNNLPFVTSYLGIDLLPYEHDLNLGSIGIKGSRAGNFAIQNCESRKKIRRQVPL